MGEWQGPSDPRAGNPTAWPVVASEPRDRESFPSPRPSGLPVRPAALSPPCPLLRARCKRCYPEPGPQSAPSCTALTGVKVQERGPGSRPSLSPPPVPPSPPPFSLISML